jgi:hypothetical protein
MTTTVKLTEMRATETLKQLLRNSSPSDTVYIEVVMAKFVNAVRTSR